MSIIVFSGAIIFFANIFFIDFGIGMNYYFLFLLFLILSLLIDTNIRFNKKYIFFHFVLLSNLAIIDIPDMFSSELRYSSFFIMSTFLGPLIRSETIDKIRVSLLSFILRLAVFVTFLSFLFILLGIDTRPPSRPDFNGLYKHSMIFGPIAGLSSIFLLHKLVDTKLSASKRYVIVVFLMTSLVSIIISGSRIAMLSVFGALIYYIGMNFVFFVVRNFKSFLLSIGLLFSSFPLWSDKTENLLNKIEYSENQNDLTASRSMIWLARFEEFKSSPIIGVGFASIGKNDLTNVDKETGKIEPGSSWLAILSMTGLLGFISFLSLLPINDLFKRSKTQNEKLLLSMVFFFFIHMLAEGYIYSAGSGLFFLFWLVLGVLNVSVNYDKI